MRKYNVPSKKLPKNVERTKERRTHYERAGRRAIKIALARIAQNAKEKEIE